MAPPPRVDVLPGVDLKRNPKTRASAVAGAQRRDEIMALRVSGLNPPAIGKKLGISRQRVHKIITEELDKLNARTSENTEQARRLELARLDVYLNSIKGKLKRGSLGAIDRALAIGNQRAKLLGLNAPVQIEDVTPEKPLEPADAQGIQAALLERAGLSVVSYAPPGSNDRNGGGNGGPSRN